MLRAVEVPLEVTAAAAKTARLGAAISEDVKPALAGDLATAVQLAAAGARAAANLVVINVRAGNFDDDLIRQANRNVDAAEEALTATSRVTVPS
jgi:formiminotetrahydrofolate cyclodeaminase